MRIVLLVCLTLGFYQLHGQINEIILTKEQNEQWIKEFKAAEIVERKFMLINRIANDTSVNVSFPYSDRLTPDYHNFDKKKPTGYCKPLLIIDFNQFAFTNRTYRKKIEQIIDVLHDGRFKKIEILNDKNAFAIYGQRAECGIIVLESANRKTRKKVNKIKTEHNNGEHEEPL